MSTGALGHLAVSRQNSFGTNTASWFFLPFVSETLVHQIDLITQLGIKASLVEPGVVAGHDRAEGDIVMEPHPRDIGHFLRGVFGQASSINLTSVTGFQDYKHTFTFRLADFGGSSPLPPYTTQIYRGVDRSYQFTDAIFPRMELVIETGALVRATAHVMARTTSLMAQPTATFPTATPWTWAVASVSLGGSANTSIEAMTLVLENPVEGILILDNTRRWGRFGRNGFPNVRLSGRFDLGDLTEYSEFVSQTERRLLLHLAPMVTSGPYLTIDVPSFRYEGVPVQVGGPGRVAVDFAARGVFNTGSNQAIEITLVNSQVNYQ